MKTYIVLPFKDRNGKYGKALSEFIIPFTEYLNNNLPNYEIIIVEQLGGSYLNTLPKYYSSVLSLDSNEEFFNLGRTTNIGFDLFKDITVEDIFMFHPIDLLPVDVDYNMDSTTKLCFNQHSPDGHYYKSIAFKVSDYLKVNGFSNKYWGWGLEDDDMKRRLNRNNIHISTKIDTYHRLTNDGNGVTDEEHFMPLYHYNKMFLDNHEHSGLNDLEYKILAIEEFKGIKKYIIE